METFNFTFDAETSHVFPKKIYEDPEIYYHGTADYHSNQIETNGFLRGLKLFPEEGGSQLLEFLQTNGYEVKSVLDGIENHLKYDLEISFAGVGACCIPFSSDLRKGGQAFSFVRRAEEFIKQLPPEVQNDLPDTAKKVFENANAAFASPGVIYAVKLENRTKITRTTDVVFSERTISVTEIIGKVFLPNKLPEANPETLKKHNRKRLSESKFPLRDKDRFYKDIKF